jgi:hypothetical protein
MDRTNTRMLRRFAGVATLPLMALGCVLSEPGSPCGEDIPFCAELMAGSLGCPSDGRFTCCRWEPATNRWVTHEIRLTCNLPDAWEPRDGWQDDTTDAGGPDAEPDPGPDGAVDAPLDPMVDPGPDVPPDVPPDPGPDLPADIVQDLPGELPSDVPADLVPDVPPLPADLVLDPNSLTFFDLPIGSIRFAVSGHDPEARVCVTLVWDFSNTGREPGAFCDDFGPGFPYAIVIPDTDGPCGAWEYAETHPVQHAEGCLDMVGFTGTTGLDYVSIVATIGPAESPTRVVVDNRAQFDVPPVFLGLSFYGDLPRDAWVQTGDDYGLPTWVQIRDDDGPILMFDRCDLPVCGEGGGVCGIAMHRAVNVTGGGTSGGIRLTWDGHRRIPDEATSDCWRRVPMPAGEYTARFCWSDTVDEGGLGPDVQDPHCTDVPFQFPTERVGMQVSIEG